MSQTHISGDRLVELSTLANPTDGEAAHLRSCSQCEYERQQLGRLLEDASALATAEADAQFPEDRLTRQRGRILQRLQQLGRPARVIAFPGAGSTPEVMAPTRPTSRWIAAAAVAGLLVGVIAGRAEHDFAFRSSALRGIGAPQEQLASRATTPLVGLEHREPAIQEAAMATDEDLLVQIENAADRGLAVLEGLDELTPLPWELR